MSKECCKDVVPEKTKECKPTNHNFIQIQTFTINPFSYTSQGNSYATVPANKVFCTKCGKVICI